LNNAPKAAQKAVQAVTTILLAGAATARSAGAFLSVGFANGMESMLSRVKTAANKIVREANRAIEAAAKIGSPSKITTQYGEWYGEGYVNGISNMVRDAKHVAAELFSVPNVAAPNLAYAYAGELSSEFDYYRSADYTISVPVVLDGKEVARVTAPYTQEELNKRQAREDRKHGRV
jgi:phage-related protein